MKKTNETPLFDGAALKELKPASNATITATADHIDWLAAETEEWVAARKAVRDAEAKVEAIGDDGVAAVRALAERLRKAVTTRTAADDKYNSDIWERCYEVTTIHKGLPVQPFGLRGWADGSTPIDKPLKYIDGTFAEREYPATVTDENRDAIDKFKPVLKAAPDTSAIRIEPPAEIKAVRELELARARLERATKALADALHNFNDSHSALYLEAAAEAESIEKATATQKERDAANAAK